MGGMVTEEELNKYLQKAVMVYKGIKSWSVEERKEKLSSQPINYLVIVKCDTK